MNTIQSNTKIYPYVACFINLFIGLGLIYFNRSLATNNYSALANDYFFTFQNTSTLFGYVLSFTNFVIFYRYLVAAALILSSMLIYTKLRRNTIDVFTYWGFSIVAAFLSISYFIIFYVRFDAYFFGR